MSDPVVQDGSPARGTVARVLERIRTRVMRRGGTPEMLLSQARARHIHVRLVLGIAIVIAIVGHADRLYTLPGIGVLDRVFYDFQVHFSMPGGVDDRVTIVDIDERSLSALGRWPWRRDVVATLVDQLFDRYNVTVVGFDVAFAEPDVSDGAALLEQIKQRNLPPAEYQEIVQALAPIVDRDTRLARALEGRPVVLSYYFSADTSGEKVGSIGVCALSASALAERGVNATRWTGYSGNL